jgi:hypothetical protein
MTQSAINRFGPSKRGFALIVTLSLMILLTVIAVGLLTLSSISLRSSTQSESSAIARANARLALMMAIGELQKEMGPDSRISAPNDANPTPPAGGQPRWTAVYDAWQQPTDPTTPETPASRTLNFRSWLVSGANQAKGGPAGVGENVLLVGPGSLKTGAKPEDQISVPMHGILVGNNRGRFGWWISDESTKAKINAGGLADQLATAAKPLFDAQSPSYVGQKAVTELSNFTWKKGERSASVSNGVVNLAAGLTSKGIGGMNHDITVHSAGVLSDVRTGRLKRDLSSLLARPVTELQNMPLYLADGRMNRFGITDAGVVSNMAGLPANATGANRWGINLEELHLFHQIHREVDWSTGKPRLVSKNSTTEIFNDRFFMYRTPTLEAVSLILAFIASPEAGTAPTTYRIDATMDVIVSLSNPNDIPTVWPASVPFRTETEGFPYRPDWNIKRGNNVIVSHKVQEINSGLFKSSILGGFTIEAGEAAVFGASVTDTSSQSVNLTRGYAPRGGLSVDDKRWDSNNRWDPAVDGLRATRLLPTDKMDFAMVPGGNTFGGTPSGWIQSYVRIGTSGTKIRNYKFGGGGNSGMTAAPINTYVPSSIKPVASSMPTIQNFIGTPLPVLMVTTLCNVERSRTALTPPNALPSRPYLLREPATSNMTSITNSAANFFPTMQNSQLVTIAEPMDYAFGNDRTMAGGVGGRNLYHGGARETGLGGSLTVVKRRIPLAAPLSLGAFENAIACGFVQRIAGGSALSGAPDILPTVPVPNPNGPQGQEPQATQVTLAKSIGNSWSNPFMASGLVQEVTYHDASWMANTALWDSWFLSSIVDGRGLSSSAWMSDSRSPRAQFEQFAGGSQSLRNKRFSYYPQEGLADALDELFQSDETFKPAGINKLPKYLLADGAFNVNSTSETAWKAFLTSVKEQELLDANGASQKKTHPFGTLGYAVTAATSGIEGDWNGFRDLTDTEMDTLSKAIVVEVKARGPFLNMADFVNRRPNSADATQQAIGALQAAIDKSGINNRFKSAGRTLTALDIPKLAAAEPTPARAFGGAGFLSQAALLTAFGSQIAVRGDTFVIRSYGDHRDASGKILSKAWCEAVVQRFPDYADKTDEPDAATVTSSANKTFGRKFGIVSFRWLSPQEI